MIITKILIRRYVGIIPPLKNIVMVINIVVKFFIFLWHRGFASGYAIIEVKVGVRTVSTAA